MLSFRTRYSLQVEFVAQNEKLHFLRDKSLTRTIIFDSFTNFGGRDVVEGCVNEFYIFMFDDGRGVGLWARVNQYGEVVENLLVGIPFVENLRIVATDEQGDSVVRILLLQSLERMNRIARLWEVLLDIGQFDVSTLLQRQPDHRLPHLVGGEFGRLLQRILWRHADKHLVSQLLVDDALCQSQMAVVERVERASVENDIHVYALR